MPGVTFEPQTPGLLRRPRQAAELMRHRPARGVAVRAGMEFHHRRAERLGGLELDGLGVDEQGDPNAGLAEGRDVR